MSVELDWLNPFQLHHAIACNVAGGRHSAIVAWNVAEVEVTYKPATLPATIAKVDTQCKTATLHSIACSVVPCDSFTLAAI